MFFTVPTSLLGQSLGVLHLPTSVLDQSLTVLHGANFTVISILQLYTVPTSLLGQSHSFTLSQLHC
jgi:hypothetical protein